jgi:septal ring factor EnvC (AmiA/AmiB activator)
MEIIIESIFMITFIILNVIQIIIINEINTFKALNQHIEIPKQMSELQLKTGNIEVKIKKLITLHAASKAQIVALEANKQELTLKIRQQQDQIQQLDEVNSALRLAKVLHGDSKDETNTGLKIKINEITSESHSAPVAQ